MKFDMLVAAIAASLVSLCVSDSDWPYTFIDPVTTECEFVALTVGTRLADAFNSYDEFYNGNKMHHEFFHTANSYTSGFMRLFHADSTRHHLTEPFRKNKTTHSLSRTPHKSHQHHNGTSVHALNNKWLYILGDETMTSVFRSLVFPLLPSSHAHDKSWRFETWLQSKCLNMDLSTSTLGDNIVCQSQGYGGQGKLTFERRDMLLESLGSEWLHNHTALNISRARERHRRPDYLLVQMGYSACFLAYNGTKANVDIIYKSENKIDEMMQTLQQLVKITDTSNDGIMNNMTVIISLPGRSLIGDSRSEQCTWHMNRVIAYSAHKHGFGVLEREEIEYRLLFKSEHSPHPMLKVKPTLEIFAPQLIAASTLAMLACIQANTSFTI